ncbi:LuxR C-terminal-related transcriptional regulator [Phaeobacter sp. 11ANDIMAR09]|uniref:helix-turn-helix transcriptional regulator n=1 Tax=Phaeobacter sp. 11ANDIMAR09 TaxID=1225647 RepID=UPI0006C868BD|nr:LuxR C-terminal-related transcriptional regulator [Phaeobacter sp. 11ANDIMAR09]
MKVSFYEAMTKLFCSEGSFVDAVQEVTGLSGRALAEASQRLGNEVLEKGGIGYPEYLSQLGKLFVASRQFNRAEPLLSEALELTRKSLGIHHPVYSTRLNEFAELLTELGRFEEAETLRETVPQEKETLSQREVDALQLLAIGYSRAQVAKALSISEHTLRVYLESARFKLGALNSTHTVAMAVASGQIVV